MKRTIAEIAEALSVSEDAAKGLVKFLGSTSPPMIRFVGERPNPGGRGKGAYVYVLESEAPGSVGSLLERLR